MSIACLMLIVMTIGFWKIKKIQIWMLQMMKNFQVGQDAYVNYAGGASLEDIGNPNLNHLDIPNFDNDGDEDAMEEDDYYDYDLNNLLD
ncbi:hypothetical protein Lal_00015304 [Lupinus albus]|nr:hypothetical protein Lal_00015304 [Lupinus albus]